LLVVGVDVAHVHATWFRTYFDREEVWRRKGRYLGVPLVAYFCGVLAYQASEATFWRVLAYAAVFHFVRQQAGWVALYRARAGEASLAVRVVDSVAIYSATLVPLFIWHTRAAEKSIAWFVAGDFVALPLASWVPFAKATWLIALLSFVACELARFLRTRELQLGKTLLVLTTALTWYVGIVATDSDFVFTATNVIPHGVPYAWLLFAYSRERSRERPDWTPGHVAAGGFAAFVLVLIGLSFFEQLGWDRWVEHDREWLFGEGRVLSRRALSWLVPLLALPQASHYLLDAFIWRRGEARALPALRRTFGFVARAQRPLMPSGMAEIEEVSHGAG
jgi:hypothetical protein